jgi:hypothetical protein
MSCCTADANSHSLATAHWSPAAEKATAQTGAASNVCNELLFEPRTQAMVMPTATAWPLLTWSPAAEKATAQTGAAASNVCTERLLRISHSCSGQHSIAEAEAAPESDYVGRPWPILHCEAQQVIHCSSTEQPVLEKNPVLMNMRNMKLHSSM